MTGETGVRPEGSTGAPWHSTPPAWGVDQVAARVSRGLVCRGGSTRVRRGSAEGGLGAQLCLVGQRLAFELTVGADGVGAGPGERW
jgi:hypothetical protein